MSFNPRQAHTSTAKRESIAGDSLEVHDEGMLFYTQIRF
jgi:hypothetical protein